MFWDINNICDSYLGQEHQVKPEKVDSPKRQLHDELLIANITIGKNSCMHHPFVLYQKHCLNELEDQITVVI